jgi:hypothetical protein
VIVDKLLQESQCTGISYSSDIEPWPGQRFGIALMPPRAGDRQPVVVALQVSDEDAARKAVATLDRCNTSGTPTGVAFDNGFMLVARTQAQATDYARAADAHSLSDNAAFHADMDSLGDLGVMTAWMDVRAVVRADGGELVPGSETSALTGAFQRVAATFRFAGDHVEVASSIYGDTTDIDHADNPIVHLPGSTVFALSESGGDQRIAHSWRHTIGQARSQDPGIDQQLAQIQAQTGLRLPADLETLLGHNLLLAMDSRGLTAANMANTDPSLLNIGLRLTNDPAKLNALYAKVLSLMGPAAGGQLPVVERSFSDGIAVATNPSYAATLGHLDGDLGNSDAFRSVVDDGADQEFVLFFDFDSVKAQLIRAMRNDGASQEAIDNVEPLKAFGISADTTGRYEHVTIRLSVDG